MTRPGAAADPRRAPLLRLADVTFPSRDQTLAAVAEALSGPETGPPADNLISNEDSAFRVSDRVARQAPRGGVYLGVGPDQNFTLLAPTEPSLAFLIDFRRRNGLLHLLHKALMLLAPTRADYLARLLARVPRDLPANPTADDLVAAFAAAPFRRDRLAATTAEVAAVLGPLGVVAAAEWPALATLQAKLAGPGLAGRFLALPMYPTLGRLLAARDAAGVPSHFLAREAWYATVRDLHRGDRIVPVVGDLADTATLARLAGWLASRRLAVATCYLSDVEFFLVRAGRYPGLAAGLRQLPWADGAIVIRTSTREISHADRLPGASSTTIIRPAAPFLNGLRTDPAPPLDRLFR